ncbi:DALR anticodon-binding domain-containing protein [Actinopolymorpha singaporensis]
MLPDRLADQIGRVLDALVRSGHLPSTTGIPGEIRVERPFRNSRGDYASPVALRLAGAYGSTPGEVARLVAAALQESPEVAHAEAAGGFVNVVVNDAALAETVREVVAAGPAYGEHPVMFAPPDDELGHRARFAHARLAGLLRAGPALEVPYDPDRLEVAVLADPPARRLVCALAELPSVAARESPRALHKYLTEILSCVEEFEVSVAVLPRGDEPSTAAHGTRLVLVDAARITLASALRRYGLCAPDRL